MKRTFFVFLLLQVSAVVAQSVDSAVMVDRTANLVDGGSKEQSAPKTQVVMLGTGTPGADPDRSGRPPRS
jgi:hypothetical protein